MGEGVMAYLRLLDECRRGGEQQRVLAVELADSCGRPPHDNPTLKL